MRFMFDDYDDATVEEIIEIDAAPSWNPDKYETEINPGSFIVTLYRPGWRECEDPDEKVWCYEINGEYNLDGTKETYKKALQNYKKIAHQMLTKGYCKSSDFENFTWF